MTENPAAEIADSAKAIGRSSPARPQRGPERGD